MGETILRCVVMLFQEIEANNVETRARMLDAKRLSDAKHDVQDKQRPQTTRVGICLLTVQGFLPCCSCSCRLPVSRLEGGSSRADDMSRCRRTVVTAHVI